MAGGAGSCVCLSLQAALTPKLQPQKSLRTFPEHFPKARQSGLIVLHPKNNPKIIFSLFSALEGLTSTNVCC